MPTTADDALVGNGDSATHQRRLVGRATELSSLRSTLGRPGLILVEGEAGIGKTRLVQELLADHDHALVACCPPFQDRATLGPIVDALRADNPDVARLRLSRLTGALRLLLPDWTDLPQPLEPLTDARETQHRLLRAVAELLHQLGVTLLIVEDAHWADDATLELLLFLTTGQPTLSILVTYRPEEVPSDSLLRRLSARAHGDGTHRIMLDPLSVPDTRELVSAMLAGDRVSAELVDFVHTQTDGLPLAVRELVQLLQDRADLIRVDGAWCRRDSGDVGVPTTIRDAVQERVARLSEETRRLLYATAVVAEPADELLLGGVAELSSDQARTAAIEALERGLLIEDERGRFGFVHALTARAVYDALPGPIRRALHHHAGEALALGRTPAARTARHFRESGDLDSWSRYAERAADTALDAGDDASAAEILNDLLQAELPPDTLGRVVEKMPSFTTTGYLHRSGLLESLRTTLGRGLLSRRQRAELRAQLGTALIRVGRPADAVVEFQAAVPDLGHDPIRQAYAMTGLALPYATDWPVNVHRQWLHRATDTTTRTPLAEHQRLELLVSRITALLALGDPDGWTLAEELPDVPETPAEATQIARAALNLNNSAMLWGRYAEARRFLDRAEQIAEQRGLSRLRDMTAVNAAHLDWYLGHWDDIGRSLARMLEVTGDPPIRLEALTLMGLLEAAQGDLASAEQRLGEVVEEAAARGLVREPHEPAATLAALFLGRGEVAQALSLTEAPMRLIAAKGTWLWAHELAPLRVAALVAADRHDEATALTSAFEQGMTECGAATGPAAVAMCRGRLLEGSADRKAAAKSYAAASQLYGALPRPHLALLAREHQARCLVQSGQREDGTRILDTVRAGLSELGATNDVARIDLQLRDFGAAAGARGRRGYGKQLSPRELEVARLVATGLTTKAIAEALSRSPKTVATQLNSAMRKLGVNSRTALAVAVTQAGFVDA